MPTVEYFRGRVGAKLAPEESWTYFFIGTDMKEVADASLPVAIFAPVIPDALAIPPHPVDVKDAPKTRAYIAVVFFSKKNTPLEIANTFLKRATLKKKQKLFGPGKDIAIVALSGEKWLLSLAHNYMYWIRHGDSEYGAANKEVWQDA